MENIFMGLASIALICFMISILGIIYYTIKKRERKNIAKLMLTSFFVCINSVSIGSTINDHGTILNGLFSGLAATSWLIMLASIVGFLYTLITRKKKKSFVIVIISTFFAGMLFFAIFNATETEEQKELTKQHTQQRELKKAEKAGIEAEKKVEIEQENNAKKQVAQNIVTDQTEKKQTVETLQKKETYRLLGLNREQVKSIFSKKGYHPTKSYYSYDLAFQIDRKVEAHVIFNDDGVVTGVDFLSLDASLSDNGSDSYVYKHHDELVQWVTGGENVLIEHNITTKYPCDVYIGDDRSDD